MLKEENASTDETTEVVGTKPEETQETTGVIDSTLGEAGTEQTEQPEAGSEQTAAEIDWAKHNLPQFVGKDPEYVANYVRFRDRKYGEQANELGELRKGKEEYEKLKAQITGQEAPEKTTSDITDVELAIFAEEFNRNPYAAMNKYYLPKLTDTLTKTIFDKVKEQFGPVLEEQATSLADKQEFGTFAKEHPDWHKYQDVMKGLMTDDYIGEDTTFEEAYKLAKLQAEEPSLFENTCSLMRKGMSFDESKEYASYKQSAAANAEAKVEQVKSEVNAAAGGLKITTTKSGTSEPVIKTMDDAFA